VLAVVDLPQATPGRFLSAAVDFCNDRLRGTLNATVIVDPATARAAETGVARAVEALRYGSIGVNVWAAAAFPLGVTPWGRTPGIGATMCRAASGSCTMRASSITRRRR
jgi:hypothetical protein